MNKFQLILNQTECFTLNFDPALEAALREVRYLKRAEVPNIPEEALKIFDETENLTAAIHKLNKIVDWYNYLATHTNQYESDLIHEELEFVKSQMLLVTEVHTWYTNG